MAETKPFSDHFGSVSSSYAKFRPTYPAALFDWLASAVAARGTAWDCACGSGQASVDLAARFDRVIATDASAGQIESATPHARVEYRVAPAERSGLPAASVDCVTVAQALHWFDLDAFFAEVRRVTKPGGALVVWSYGVPRLENAKADALVQTFYSVTVGPYWPPERAIVEAGYDKLPFPFEEIPVPELAMTADWPMAQLLGYFASWSATARYVAAHGRNPVREFAEELTPAWGDPDREVTVAWPLACRAGRV
jgi:ubiquinone/menaquinone biosynthesis C-methylase UbiE